MNKKKTTTTIAIMLLLSFGLQGHAQSFKNMNNTPFKIPLKKGKNEVIKYKTLEITPVNLFIQDKPWNDRSAHIQLELNIKEDNKTFHTFLWYYEKGKNPLTDYPLASGKYGYSLEISSQESVKLVVDTLSFGNPFFISFRQDVKIGDLTINFSESVDVMGASSEEGTSSGSDSYAEYYLTLSENKEQKSLNFLSSNVNNKDGQALKWKEYEITVLYDDLKLLKLNVFKRPIKK